MRETTRLDIRLRIDFGSVSSLGPGKVALLEHIERAGSLSQAARELGLSYRRAWQLLDDLNHSFRDPVASASVGGVGGGGVQLTAFAKELIAAYRRVESAALNETRTQFASLVKAIEPERSLGSRLRRLLTRRAPKARKAPAARSRAH
jgi:molybdate transport system regulatory protein